MSPPGPGPSHRRCIGPSPPPGRSPWRPAPAGPWTGRPLGPAPSTVLPGLGAMEIDPAEETDRYIADVKDRVREATSPRLLEEVERQIDVARVSPGAEEAALFN